MMNVKEYGNGLIQCCINHRERYGIREPLKRHDCTSKACKTGCPIKRMPQALTKEELEEIEREVAFEELSRMKQEKIESLQ